MAQSPSQDYSRADVRRMLGVSERNLRSWERQGLIAAASAFTFSDLIALRALQKLQENRIPAKSIGRAITSLKQKLAGIKEPLSELKIVSDGKTISVQVAGQRMEALTGQLLFDFDASGIENLKAFPSEARESEQRTLAIARERQAEHWFQQGLALEETGAPLNDAVSAYRQAIELNPNASGALVNLGTISYRLRRFAEAEQFYLRAIEAEPRYALAHFNLGNLYDEQRDFVKGRLHYEEALKLSSDYADAHFNLALLCERTGEPLRAMSHWKAYLKLDSASSWAKVARRQLESLKQSRIVQPKS